MKSKYEPAELEIIYFGSTDIVCTSADFESGDPNELPIRPLDGV